MLMAQRFRSCSLRIPHERAMLDQLLRVDHAGEVAAHLLYAGQLAVMRIRGSPSSDIRLVEHMRLQEIGHLERIETMLSTQRVRPSALLPLWKIAGMAVGAGSALLGDKAAMAATVAVEEVIAAHYNEQLREITQSGINAPDVKNMIVLHRDEENEHRHIGIKHGAYEAPMYWALTHAIKIGCKTAIEIAKRV